jgi:uncharacterized alkaline shock family protein YloU
VPTHPIPGRSLVTRRALRDVVRNAALGVYGVSGLRGHGPFGGLLDALGLGRKGIGLDLHGPLTLDLHLTVAYGLPIAEVARQVDASVRYAVAHAIGREPDRISIHIEGLRYEPGSPPPAITDPLAKTAPGPADLAGSGTDVA